ncbi:SMI1/KNR4 family protein [Mucilaginibacter corticis]|uniref:SMI1/KNR4 family protein n=1 Tax=Mucilaginibacter corticis TaxID=2597670 RepID=A0A556MWP6_9SPHI|nr:SMI1/KNR4 family protein [Mucilaginibacter corticis]TSJ44341.1 SMI1/KNR4 family protein [Mucilaginibacter corticis]
MNNKNTDAQELAISDSDILEINHNIKDSGYLKFITVSNGGFFFDNSLQIYSVNNIPDFRSIYAINEVIKRAYSSIIKDDFFFAQEIFGNQFGFTSNGIVFLNIETGERNIIASDFDDWINVLKSDLNFLTGKNIIQSWNNANESIDYNERLCPKKPFVIGGDYKVENLYPSVFPKYLLLNANIASQIFNLPDGTAVKLNIKS